MSKEHLMSINLLSLVTEEELKAMPEERRAGFVQAVAILTTNIQVSGFGHVIDHIFGENVKRIEAPPPAPITRSEALRALRFWFFQLLWPRG